MRNLKKYILEDEFITDLCLGVLLFYLMIKEGWNEPRYFKYY